MLSMHLRRAQPAPAPSPAQDLQIRPWAVAWGGVVAAAFVNGAVHRAYGNVLDELTAHQVSTVVLLVLVAPWVLRVERSHPLPTARDAATVGVLWAACTVAFESASATT